MYRLQEKLRDKKPAMGMLTKGGPNLVRHLAAGGLDFIIADMMHGRMDWDEAAHITWVARAEGLYPFVRIQGHPWGTSSNLLDRRFVVDGMKAFTLGAEGVMWSITSAAEAEALAHLAADWHQGRPVTSVEELEAMEESNRATRMLIPLIESRGAIDALDDILAIDGISGVFMAMTDLSHQLGHPHEYDHPEVVAALEHSAELAEKHGKTILANTGYTYPTPQGQADHATRLFQHGANMVMLQTTEYYQYVITKTVVDGVLENLGNESGKS